MLGQHPVGVLYMFDDAVVKPGIDPSATDGTSKINFFVHIVFINIYSSYMVSVFCFNMLNHRP